MQILRKLRAAVVLAVALAAGAGMVAGSANADQWRTFSSERACASAGRTLQVERRIHTYRCYARPQGGWALVIYS
jgi:hypothetical protein